MEVNEYAIMILNLANQIKRVFNMATDYSGTQTRILYFVLAAYPAKEIYQKDLEDELNTRSASISTMLKKMEHQGLIIRERVSRDDRLKKILPTSYAIEMKEKIEQTVNLLETSMLEGISDQELEVFSKVSVKMFSNIAGSEWR